jgi:outer membrane protein
MSYRISGYLLLLLLILSPIARAQAAGASSTSTQDENNATVLRLSLEKAVEIALSPEGSTRIQIAKEMIRQAQAQSAQARAALLPNVDASVSQQSQTRNLSAFGLNFKLPIPGFVFPRLVGPYNVFDARATASQSVLDLSSIKKFQATRAGVSQAEAELESAQDQTRDLAARAYLAALRSDAAVAAAQANVLLSEALVKLANDRKVAGTSTGIEVTRAQVQLANEKQRLLVASNEKDRAHLQLLRAINLDLDADVELTEHLDYIPMQEIPLSQAIQKALESRADWKAQQRRETTVRLSRTATQLERVPSISVFADYGSIGSSIDYAIPTRAYGFTVRVPVFDGGRRDARGAEGSAKVRQEQLRTSDLRTQIELDIRLALDSLRSSVEQVKTAREGLSLAENELAQAQRRFQAGVGSSIEVTDAQTRLERARDNEIQALFNYGLARIDLNTAMGTIRNITLK